MEVAGPEPPAPAVSVWAQLVDEASPSVPAPKLPPPDPEVRRVMASFSYDAGDPRQVAAMRTRAEGIVRKRRENESRIERGNERLRQATRLRNQRAGVPSCERPCQP